MLARALSISCLLLAAPLAGAEPIRVFVLVGQSNMQGHAHVRTIDHLAMDEATRPLLARIRQRDGTPRVYDEVRIAYRSSRGVKRGRLTTGFGADGNKLGPELTFGARLHERLGAPIVLLKAAWGGKSLHTDFRPPSAGPFRFRPEQLEQLKKRGKDVAAVQAAKLEATGRYYRETVAFVRAELEQLDRLVPGHRGGYELAGIVWFQGWNDMVDSGVYPQRHQPGGYDAYSALLAHLIRDLRKALAAPTAPFVIGVMGVGGPTAEYGPRERRYAKVHQHFRDAMAAPARQEAFAGTVAAVLTETCWDGQLAALQARASQARQQARQLRKTLGPEEAKAAEAALLAKALTPRERELLAKGVSNLGFHYLGSAKILARIGVRFADAMADLHERSPAESR